MDAKLTGSARADTMVLGERSHISGTATFNQRSGSGTVGSSSSPLALPLSIAIPTLPAISPGTQAIAVTASQTQTLSEGAYGTVSLANGNGGIPTQLLLSGGLYALTQLTLGTDARVKCQAPCSTTSESRRAARAISGRFGE
jgi:hypothetical protein